MPRSDAAFVIRAATFDHQGVQFAPRITRAIAKSVVDGNRICRFPARTRADHSVAAECRVGRAALDE